MPASVAGLVRLRSEWLPPGAAATNNGHARYQASEQTETITEAMVKDWHSALMANNNRLEELESRRGLEEHTITDHQIGWDQSRRCYTIPVRDEKNELVNIRRYKFDPSEGRRKIWGVKGMQMPRLYPIDVFDEDPDEIIICEGEWDALLSTQMGIPAVTRTASASTWDSGWGSLFKGRTVYVCHDRDHTGRDANEKVRRALEKVADVRIVELPYEMKRKHGKDLTDYWLEGHDVSDFKALASPDNRRLAVEDETETEDLDPSDASVLDSFDARKVGKPLRLTVTVKGKKDPGYSIPEKVRYTCTRDAGEKCHICPMNAAGGEADVKVEPSDPLVLEMIGSKKKELTDTLREHYGALKCPKLTIDVETHQSVEELFARPSVEHNSGASGDYKNIKVTSVGRHNTPANSTMRVTGALYPDPRSQANSFQAWNVAPISSSLDNFELTDQAVRFMKRFQPRKNQRPLKKLGEISRDFEAHVTRIYGRPELHAAMDLVFHSVLAFDFGGQRIERGWLELLVVGDTRTGKSEAATQLVRHYRAGEVVLCESASFAGIVGGLQQYGSSKEWAINWGAIPLNDRRLVVLDEVSGLTPDQIAAMSDVRSRGLAQLTKIQQEVTHARTRLIWLGNPRDASMADFTYGVDAIKPLIGNPEDIARFDLAMSAMAGDVPPDEINRVHENGSQKYTGDACAALLRWAWSRTPDQIIWAKGAEAAVLEAARSMGALYVEDPPLVQAANVRVKIARVAVALAARLFSTDDSYENIVVTTEHVKDAVTFMNRIYDMKSFGYGELSKERREDIEEATRQSDDVKAWLFSRKGLAKFLRSQSTFRRQDIEEVLNVSREEANAVINTLYTTRMVRKDRGDVRVQPALHQLLREVRE
jgi:hypothetical protein